MNMRKAIIAAAAFAATLPPCNAQSGKSAYDFLTVPSSGVAYGLGGSNVAIIDDDVSLAQENPALLGPDADRQLALGYMHYLGSSNFAGVRFGMAAGDHGAWAAGIRYLNHGEIAGYDQNGSPTGSFSPIDIVAEGTYSHDFTYNIRGGINLKMVYSGYENYSAFAMAADIGINYYDDERDLSLSAVLRNMGGQLKRFEDTYDHLPFDIVLGVMKGWSGSPFSIGVTAWNLTKWQLPHYSHSDSDSDISTPDSDFASNLFGHLIFCGRYQPSERFYLDLGYNHKMRMDMAAYSRNFLSGFAIGAGIRVNAFRIGVAYSMPHKNASSILVNLTLGISDLL